PSHRSGIAEIPWKTIVGYVIFRKMEITDSQACWRIQSKGDRWSKTHSAILDDIALRNIRIMGHHIQTDCGTIRQIGQWFVDVRGKAAREVCTEIAIKCDKGP